MKILELDSNNVFGADGSGNQIKSWVKINNSKYLIKTNSKYREAIKEVSAYKLGKSRSENYAT